MELGQTSGDHHAMATPEIDKHSFVKESRMVLLNQDIAKCYSLPTYLT